MSNSALVGETYVARVALVFLQNLRRIGSMGISPAWDIYYQPQPFNDNDWNDGVLKQDFVGLDFSRKDDAMMFKLAFHNFNEDGGGAIHIKVKPR